MEKMLNVTDVADIVSVMPSTVRKWCKNGELTSYRINNTWKVYRSDLERFLRSKRYSPKTEEFHPVTIKEWKKRNA